MTKAKLIAAAVVIVLILTIIVFYQNRQPVQFSFLFFDPVQVPKTVLILGSGLLGALITLIAQYVLRRRASATPSAF